MNRFHDRTLAENGVYLPMRVRSRATVAELSCKAPTLLYTILTSAGCLQSWYNNIYCVTIMLYFIKFSFIQFYVYPDLFMKITAKLGEVMFPKS